jgi:hypothetical protein
MGRVGILFTQQSEQGNVDVFGKILHGEGLGQIQLPLQGTSKTLREKHDTGLVPLGLMDVEDCTNVRVLVVNKARISCEQSPDNSFWHLSFRAAKITSDMKTPWIWREWKKSVKLLASVQHGTNEWRRAEFNANSMTQRILNSRVITPEQLRTVARWVFRNTWKEPRLSPDDWSRSRDWLG